MPKIVKRWNDDLVLCEGETIFDANTMNTSPAGGLFAYHRNDVFASVVVVTTKASAC